MPISEVELEACARMLGYADDPERLYEFRALVKAQDTTWLEHYAEQHARRTTMDVTAAPTAATTPTAPATHD